MSIPNPLGPWAQILKVDLDHSYGFKKWHTFDIEPAIRGRDAGQWCNEHIKGEWTFRAAFGIVTFYIKDAKDAMLFKLTWHQ